MDGTINAKDDINGDTGVGIYVNGNIQHENNHPIINLTETTKITSTGTGIYAAGYATYYINGAYIEGQESALGIKSGIFNISNGTLIGSGTDKTPTTGNNNGINPSGTSIQIESNKNYKGNIELNIKNGTIESKHSNALYEYTTNSSPTSVKNINITGGTFKTTNNKPVFLLSDSFKSTHPSFISGGKYQTDPSNYLKSGYSATQENNMYEVSKSTLQVFAPSNNDNNNTITPIITITALITISIIIFINRQKILNIFK